MKKPFYLLAVLMLMIPVVPHAECIEGDCANGYGIYLFPEGGQFSGEFAGGEFAAGKQTFADGNRYEGTFVNSTPHGEGTLTYADGSVYSGQFDMGVISGRGSIVFANNSRYEGDFVDGLFNGSGVYTYSNGSQYKGEFKNGRMHGKGTLYSDGRTYKGEFKEGEYYGKGTITYYDKSQETGEWKNGEFIVLQKTKAPAGQESAKAEKESPFGTGEFIVKDAWAPPEQSEQPENKDFLQPPVFESGPKQENMFPNDNFAKDNIRGAQ